MVEGWVEATIYGALSNENNVFGNAMVQLYTGKISLVIQTRIDSCIVGIRQQFREEGSLLAGWRASLQDIRLTRSCCWICWWHALSLIALSRWSHHFAKMLRLRMLSGEALTNIPVEEMHDVKGLKQRLAQLPGLPPRFRQRVLYRGENLKDDVTLDSPMNLEVVLLTFTDVSQSQADDLAAAAMLGSIAKVGGFESVMYMSIPVQKTHLLHDLCCEYPQQPSKPEPLPFVYSLPGAGSACTLKFRGSQQRRS